MAANLDWLFTFDGGMFLPGPAILIAIVAWALWGWAKRSN